MLNNVAVREPPCCNHGLHFISFVIPFFTIIFGVLSWFLSSIILLSTFFIFSNFKEDNVHNRNKYAVSRCFESVGEVVFYVVKNLTTIHAQLRVVPKNAHFVGGTHSATLLKKTYKISIFLINQISDDSCMNPCSSSAISTVYSFLLLVRVVLRCGSLSE